MADSTLPRSRSGRQACLTLSPYLGCLALSIFGFALWAPATALRAQVAMVKPPPNPEPPAQGPKSESKGDQTGLSSGPVDGQPIPSTPALPPVEAKPVPKPEPLFKFVIAPNTPLKDLLPIPPKVNKEAGQGFVKDLAQIPEVEFQEFPAENPAAGQATEAAAYMIAKVKHLNDKKTDGFLEALRAERPDLVGLPFAMGGACRIKGERSKQFTLAVAKVREVLKETQEGTRKSKDGDLTGNFREVYQAECVEEDMQLAREDHTCQENVTLARIAALMQVLMPEPPGVRLGLVKCLSGMAHAEATRALARLAIFSPEDEVCQAAVEALKVRRERDYTDILLLGLHYPWPTVARHAAEAVAKLERTDLVPQLVGLLNEPDPRVPVVEEFNHQKVPVIHELVRINHQRNCLLCHAPASEKVSPETLTAPVSVPGVPLPAPSEGYGEAPSDLLVRIDVTYLRQDFSVMQPVEDANPWPEMQRFDYLVRTRPLTHKETETYRAKLAKPEPNRPSPYQRGLLAALRELTGRDTEPTAEAWRRVLDLPTQQP